MNEEEQSIDDIEKSYQSALHLYTITYSILKEPKLFLGIIYNIFQSVEKALQRLTQSPQDSNINSLLHKLQQLYSEDKKVISSCESLRQLSETITLHKKSTILFPRGQSLVLADKKYELKLITSADIGSFLAVNYFLITLIKREMNRKD